MERRYSRVDWFRVPGNDPGSPPVASWKNGKLFDRTPDRVYSVARYSVSIASAHAHRLAPNPSPYSIWRRFLHVAGPIPGSSPTGVLLFWPNCHLLK
jgi:hypothetical protein